MAAWDKFHEEHRGECVVGASKLASPIELLIKGQRFKLWGHRLVALDKDADSVLRIGVISATKDDRAETLEAIKTTLAQLKKLGLDVLVVNGALATVDLEMEEKLLPALATSGVLTIAHVGNTESCGLFNDAATKTFKKHPNFINGNWVRQIELDDGVLYTLPGYFDRRFSHTGGSAKYKEKDLTELRRMMKSGPGPKVLISHGPPKMNGRKGIDIASGAGHVGDPQMTEMITRAKVPFGIFGHILEAGGRASDISGRRSRKQKRWHRSLYVNAGTVNPDPWVMLNGKTSYGMGLHVGIKGKRARYRVLRLRAP